MNHRRGLRPARFLAQTRILASKGEAAAGCAPSTERPAMSFRDNLQHLRATRNMTQEQLAMLLGVSRQSVTKWEAEKSYPEMDKLLKLCQIFECSQSSAA